MSFNCLLSSRSSVLFVFSANCSICSICLGTLTSPAVAAITEDELCDLTFSERVTTEIPSSATMGVSTNMDQAGAFVAGPVLATAGANSESPGPPVDAAGAAAGNTGVRSRGHKSKMQPNSRKLMTCVTMHNG